MRSLLDELISAREKPFLPVTPTVVFAMGSVGAECICRLKEALLADGEHVLKATRFCLICDEEKTESISTAEMTKPDLTFPFPFKITPESTRREILSLFLSQRDAFVQKLRHCITDDLLKAESLRDIPMITGGLNLTVFTIGSLCEMETLGLGIEIERFIEEELGAFISGLKVYHISIFVLPEGDHPKAPLIYAFLRELDSLHSAEEKTTPQISYLISPVNGEMEGVLHSSEVAEMICEFVRLNVYSNLRDSLGEFLVNYNEAYLSFGTASAIFPAKKIMEQKGRSFTAQLIRQECLKPDSAPAEMVRKHVEDEQKTPEALYERMIIKSEGGDVFRELTLPPLLFREVEMRYWPDRIASYDGLFERDTVQRQMKIIDKNSLRIQTRMDDSIASNIDEMVKKNPSPSVAASFLEQLIGEMEKAHNHALHLAEETNKKIPQLTYFKERLIKTIQNYPSSLAVATRYGLIGLIGFYWLWKTIDFLKRHGERFVNSALLPPVPVTAVIVLVASIAGIGLTIGLALSRLINRRREYIQAVEKKHKLTVELYARRKVRQVIEAHLNSLRKLKEDVSAFREKLGKCADELEEYQETPDSTIAQSLLKRLRLSFDYKQESSAPNYRAEARTFIEKGGFDGWSNIQAEELEKRVITFATEGYEYILGYDVQNILTKHISESVRQDLISELFNRASFFLQVKDRGKLTVTPNFLFVYDESQRQTIQSIVGNAITNYHPITTYDAYRTGFCRIVSPVELANISSLPTWRRAYSAYPEKQNLHLVDDWETLPEPLKDEGEGTE